jgi:hypothetical protein
VKPVDLTNNDLVKIDSLINLCIRQNSSEISMKGRDYYKQCIAVINSQKDIEVWINLLCKDAGFSKNFKYNIIRVHDGGNCFVNLKVNLNKRVFYDLRVNGQA